MVEENLMWKTLRKICFFGCLLFTFVCVSFVFSKSVSALSMPNDFFQINRTYIPETTNWSWSAYMYLPQAGTGVCDSTCYQQYVGQIRKIQINYGNVSTQGNHATIHFELNLVSADSQANNATFFDLSNIAISNVYFRNSNGSGTALNLESYAVNTAVTYWDDNKRITLTIYGDLTLSGVPVNATGHFQLDVGSNQPFYQGRRNAQIVYFEQNPTSLIFSNNLNDALLNQQIAQNEVMIQNQQTIINNFEALEQQQQQTYDFLTDDTPPNVDSSALSQSAGWLPAGPVDSILTLPISLLQGVVNVFTNPSACQDVILPLPFVNTNLTLPCVGPILSQIGITPLWNVVGAIIGFFLIWNTLKWLYKFVDDTLTMRENESSLWGGL